MKKIISGKVYDTSTAKELGFWSNMEDHGNFSQFSETLYQKKTGEIPACLAFGLTSLICFYTGIQQNAAGDYEGLRDGKPYPVKDDAHVLTFFSGLKAPDAHAVLSNTALWGEDLTAIPGLEDKVASQLKDIADGCIRCAMRKAFAK